MCNWFLCLVFIHCIEELAWKLYGQLNKLTDIINEKIYKLGTVNMSSSLNPFLHELLGPIPNLILFWIKKTMCSSWSAPVYYAILYQCVRMSKIYNPECRSANIFEASQILDICTHMKGFCQLFNDKPVIFWNLLQSL